MFAGYDTLDGPTKNGAVAWVRRNDRFVKSQVLLDSATMFGHCGASLFSANCFAHVPLDGRTNTISVDSINVRRAPNIEVTCAMHFPLGSKSSRMFCLIAGVRSKGFGGAGVCGAGVTVSDACR